MFRPLCGPLGFGIMDPVSIASAFVSQQASQFQMAAAAKMMKMNAGSSQAIAQLLDAASQNAAKAATAVGVGQNLDITV
jgi:hypothetical protein